MAGGWEVRARAAEARGEGEEARGEGEEATARASGVRHPVRLPADERGSLFLGFI